MRPAQTSIRTEIATCVTTRPLLSDGVRPSNSGFRVSTAFKPAVEDVLSASALSADAHALYIVSDFADHNVSSSLDWDLRVALRKAR